MVDLTEITDEDLNEENARRERLKAKEYELQWRMRQLEHMLRRDAAMKAMFSIYDIPEAEQEALYNDVLDFYFKWEQ